MMAVFKIRKRGLGAKLGPCEPKQDPRSNLDCPEYTHHMCLMSNSATWYIKSVGVSVDKGSKFSVPVKPRDRAQGSTEIKVSLYPSGVGVPGVGANPSWSQGSVKGLLG